MHTSISIILLLQPGLFRRLRAREYVGWARGQVVSIRRHSPQVQPHKGILRSSCDKSLFLWLFKRPTSRLKTSFPHCASLQATLSYLCWWRVAARLRVPHHFYRALEVIEWAWFWGSQCIFWITWPSRLHVIKMRSHKAGVDSDGIWKGQGRVSLGLKEFQAQLQSWYQENHWQSASTAGLTPEWDFGEVYFVLYFSRPF